MNCAVCGKTLADVEKLPLSPGARKMLKKQLGIQGKEPSASSRICYQCSIEGQTKPE